MSRFETLVVKAMIMLALVAGANIFAKDKDGDGDDVDAKEVSRLLGRGKDLKTMIWERDCKNLDPKNKAMVKKCEQRENAQFGSRECKTHEKDFKNAESEFTSACAALDLKSGGEEGAIACSWSKEQCRCLSSKISDEDKDKYRCDEIPEASAAENSIRDEKGLINIARSRAKMEYCPDQMADDADKYEKQLDRENDKIKEAKKKLADLRKDSNKDQKDSRKAQNDVKKRAAEKQKEYSDGLQKIREEKENKENQLVQEMMGIRAKIDEIDSNIRKIGLAQATAAVKLSEAKTNIELNCHASASTMVSKLQAERLEYEKAKRLNRGNFNAMLKNVGISDRAAWQRKAKIYYDRCMKSKPTRDSIKLANNAYNDAIKASNEQTTSLYQAKRREEENLNNYLSNNGCAPVGQMPGQAPTEKKMCAAARNAHEKAQALQAQNQVDQAQMQDELTNSMMDGATSQQGLGADYAEATRDINEAQQRANNIREYLNLRAQKAGSRKDGEKMNTAYPKLTAAAQGYDQCCEDGELKGANCDRVKKFLESIGMSSQQDNEADLDGPGVGVDKPEPPADDATPGSMKKMKLDGKAEK